MTPGVQHQDSTQVAQSQNSNPPATDPQNQTTPGTQQQQEPQNQATPSTQPQTTAPPETQPQNPATPSTQQQPPPPDTQQQQNPPSDTRQQPPPPATEQGESSSESKGKTTGKVYVSVLPEEAYIWVDGKPASHRSSLLKLPVGEHKITVYNYGFAPDTQTVTVTGGQNHPIEAHLKPTPGTVAGPWGRIQIEGVPGNSLVFMNGTTPEFFVGHADEMNNNFLAKQQLVVPAGEHQLYVVRRKTNEPIWSGQVDVKENKRLILYVKNSGKGNIVYKDWGEGKKIKDLKRFEAGTASATIAVARVTGKLAVDQQEIKCNQPVKLAWNSTEATVGSVTANDQKLAESANGDLAVQPKQTTKYEFRAAGPGGTVVQEATVNVDTKVQASLNSSTQDVRYVKVGDKVEEQGTAELQWSAANADSVTIDPGGTVTGNSGTQSVQVTPSKTEPGPLDETKTYKLTATNVCGGSDTKTVAVRLTGSIEPEQVAQAEPPPEPQPQLPATASPMPLLAVLGFGTTMVGVLLKRFRK